MRFGNRSISVASGLRSLKYGLWLVLLMLSAYGGRLWKSACSNPINTRSSDDTLAGLRNESRKNGLRQSEHTCNQLCQYLKEVIQIRNKLHFTYLLWPGHDVLTASTIGFPTRPSVHPKKLLIFVKVRLVCIAYAAAYGMTHPDAESMQRVLWHWFINTQVELKAIERLNCNGIALVTPQAYNRPSRPKSNWNIWRHATVS